MKFKKVDENKHGPIVAVFTDHGFRIGTIEKWHGLFVGVDWDGNKHMPEKKRQEAADLIEQRFDYELSLTL